MKRFLFITCLALTLTLDSSGQNLLVNGGFEPDDCELPAWRLSEICAPWDTLGDAGDWQDLIVQYYGECSSRGNAGSRDPRSGRGCIGIPTHGWPASAAEPHQSRGYPIGELTQTLTQGQTYQLSFWVQTLYSSNAMIYATQGPGALFTSTRENLNFNNEFVLESDNAIYGTEIVSEVGEWTQICMTFTATGYERFMILGNFRTNEDTPKELINPNDDPDATVWKWSYYLIDDVVLIPYEAQPAVLPSSAGICPDEDLTLSLLRVETGQWDDGSTEPTRVVSEPGTYGYTYLDGACFRTDFIEVSEVNCEKCHVYLPTAFTPNGDGNNDEWKPELVCDAIEYRVEVYDRLGNLMFRTFNIDEGWSPPATIQEGTYVARIQMTYELYGERDFIDERALIVIMK